jgi:uncharacterized protein (TIGR02099 family)
MIRRLLQALLKFFAYSAAGVVILLAIALGLFRLFLPRLPEYQEDIKAWASAAIGMNVEFSGMDARWGLRGPEVEFYDAELIARDTQARVIAAEEVGVGVGLMRLLVDRKFVVDRVMLRETRLEVRQLEDGSWSVQGSALDQLLPKRRPAPQSVARFEVLGEDIEVAFFQPGEERAKRFRIPRVTVSRNEDRLAVDAVVDLPGSLGQRMLLAATQLQGEGAEAAWNVSADIDDLDLAGVSSMHRFRQLQFSRGSGNVNVALEIAAGSLRSATADLELLDVAARDEPGIGVSGVLEFRRSADGWLAAGNGLRLQTPQGTWPETTLRVEASTDAEGEIALLDARASYLRLDDYRILAPWLSAEQYDLVAAYDPNGVVRDLAVTLADLHTESVRYDVSAELVEAGIAALADRPGVRGFSASLRADQSGGRLHMEAPGLAVTSNKFLGDVVYLDEAVGTVVWRRSDNRTTVLSDRILLRNADLALEASIEVSLADDSKAPIVDVAASWSIEDLASAKRYIPFIPRIPKTSEWFQNGLLAGRIPRGSARLYGPLDKFPFDNGEGRLLIEAEVENGRLIYQERWPMAQVRDAKIVVENTRLYSAENRFSIVGNEVNNARIEIGDFRLPVLTVNAYTAGPIDAVRQLLMQSPVGIDVFGGKLEEITVTGNGSFSIDLRVPVRDWRSFEFTSRLQTSGAAFSLQGFPAPVTDLSGIITVERENISSESLGGTFLGRPVVIDLQPAPVSMPEFRIVAHASGMATAEALAGELRLPLEGRTSGAMGYRARLLFPRGNEDDPAPFTVEIETDMEGFALDLPQPLQKVTDELLPTFAVIELPKGGDRISSSGTAAGLMSWDVLFEKPEDRWDLDRGIINFGPDTEPLGLDAAETRGLHLRGSVGEVFMQNWFDMAKQGGGAKTGMGERIRSIDLAVSDLHIIGQHLVDHHVRVDRSARDWLVQVDGEDVVGSAVIPYDFQSGRELVVDMERLVLPGEEQSTGDGGAPVDPRSLPPISIKAAEFAFGTRFFGEIEARFRHTADGLESESIATRDGSFEINGSGGWIVDESDPQGNRSYVKAQLASRDVERTMRRLGYEPGIVADDATMNFDLSWSGGPAADFMKSLDGEVRVRIGTGQLSDVEPGAGRMFGLMSVVALPRRLSLDFRDVFSKGFGFDKIDGTFRIEDGDTYTCDLSLEGPAADIGIIGRAGLVARDYDQVAVVNANFGNTLPVVGGVLGGPQVAAVMLIFSQLFKKPLQEATQIYYGITGSWDEPDIESSSARRLAEHAEMSGCIAKAE